MATYTLFTASYGVNYANLRVRILEQATGAPAIIMATATSGMLSAHGNVFLDSSGNLSVYLDSSKTFTVWYNQFQLGASGISLATEIQRTASQLAGTPTLSDIGQGFGATFFLDTNPAAQYRISADKTQYVAVTGGGGGITSLTGASDYTTNLVTPLAAKVATTAVGAANGVASLGGDSKVPTGQITGKLATTDLTDGAALNTAVGNNTTAITGKIGIPQNWNGTTPALVSSTNPFPTYGTNAFIYNGSTSAVLDGLTFNPTDMAVFSSGVYTKVVLGGGYLGTFGSTGALQTAYPAASNVACTALISGVLYASNGSAWSVLGAGGGGSTTLAALTDMGTYDLGVNNPSVNTIKTTANAALPAAQKGAASGVASLDSTTHIPAAQLPAPTASTLGGVQSAALVSHQFVTGISTSGVPSLAQPASTDLSDSANITRVVGTYANVAALQAAFPAGSNGGNRGLVGSAAPYSIYASDGTNWNLVLTNLGTYASTAALQTAYPAASYQGEFASVGSSAPYLIYQSNGTAWVQQVTSAQVAAASGVASLGSDTKVPVGQMTGKLATTDLTDGAALNAQVAANTAALSVQTINAQTGTTYTFVLADAGQNVDLSNVASITATIPPHSSVPYPVGTLLPYTQAGAGVVTIAAGAGVTLTKRSTYSYSTSEQLASGYAYQVSQDNWRVYNG
jgi:hypothetical protein